MPEARHTDPTGRSYSLCSSSSLTTLFHHHKTLGAYASLVGRLSHEIGFEV
jgi:hypothetical protein